MTARELMTDAANDNDSFADAQPWQLRHLNKGVFRLLPIHFYANLPLCVFILLLFSALYPCRGYMNERTNQRTQKKQQQQQ